jgi:hypothetical protein
MNISAMIPNGFGALERVKGLENGFIMLQSFEDMLRMILFTDTGILYGL